MGFKTPAAKPQADPTAYLKAEDESLATNKAAVAIPFLIGEGKSTTRWLTPIYGQKPYTTGGATGKNAKNGGGQSTTIYRGTIAGALGVGPAYSIEWMIYNGVPYDFNLTKPVDAEYVTLNIDGPNTLRFYFGTQDQTADDYLEAFEEQPAYRGQVYLVLIHCSFGNNGETQAPLIQVGWRRLPQQEIIVNTLGSAENDGAFTANPITVAAELLTGWDFIGLPTSAINAASFQATADVLQALRAEGASDGDDTDRSAVAIAPMWSERVSLREALAEISRLSKAWFRHGTDGKIEAGYWRRDGVYANATALTPDDLSEIPEITVAETDNLPNSFVIEFTDSTKHHKSNCITVNNTARIRNDKLRRVTARRPFLLRDDQARIAGAELLRDAEAPVVTINLVVRREKARNVDGTAIRVGDYFSFPVQMLAGDAADARVFRCTRREFEPFGPVTLFGELETNGALQAVVPVEEETPITPAMAPIYFRRLFSLPKTVFNSTPPIYSVAARPDDLAIGYHVEYCDTEDGEFQHIGTQPTYALPVSLVASLAADASTVRVKLLDESAEGADPRRDVDSLTSWQGGVLNGNNDEFLLILVAKNGGGTITACEALSVSGPAVVFATDTYDVPVLRGRRGTTATAFTAGSFPDVWTNYEGWFIRRAQLEAFTHSDFRDLSTNGDTVYFRYTPFSAGLIYDGTSAHAEFDRLTAATEPLAEFEFQTDETHQPVDPFSFPFSRPVTYYTDLLPPMSGSIAASERHTGGAWSLVGFAEYTSNGTPLPEKYLQQVGSGTYEIKAGNGPAGTQRYVNDSVGTYDAATGVGPTEASGTGLHVSWPVWECDGPATSPTIITGLLGPGTGIGQVVTVLTPTTWSAKNGDNIFGWGGCNAGMFTSWATALGSQSYTLSNKDTEANALARLFASEPALDSLPWTPISGFPAGMSIRETRESGYSAFAYNGEFQLEGSGFTPSTDVSVAVTFVRIDTVSLATTEFIRSYSATTDGSGDFTLEEAFPVETGYSIKLEGTFEVRAAVSEGSGNGEG